MVEHNVVVHSHVHMGTTVYTIVMVERDVVVHSHEHMVTDVCILLLWLNITWLYIVMYIWETTCVYYCYG